MLSWNKLDRPKSGITYVGDWRTPISLWWIDSSKEDKLNRATKNNEDLPIEPIIIDYWNRID